MYSKNLPTIEKVKEKYDIKFDDYSILMYHPVTTEVDKLEENIKHLVDAIIESDKNYVVIYPNNDSGSDIILNEYKRLEEHNKCVIYPSMRFEYFLTLLKECDFIIGNSSSGIREACAYGKVAIDLGNRQKGRYSNSVSNIMHTVEEKNKIMELINQSQKLQVNAISHFGNGNSDEKFMQILENNDIWNRDIQKKFIDINF